MNVSLIDEDVREVEGPLRAAEISRPLPGRRSSRLIAPSLEEATKTERRFGMAALGTARIGSFGFGTVAVRP